MVATVVLIFCSVADIVLAVIQDGKYDLNNCSFTKASGEILDELRVTFV